MFIKSLYPQFTTALLLSARVFAQGESGVAIVADSHGYVYRIEISDSVAVTETGSFSMPEGQCVGIASAAGKIFGFSTRGEFARLNDTGESNVQSVAAVTSFTGHSLASPNGAYVYATGLLDEELKAAGEAGIVIDTDTGALLSVLSDAEAVTYTAAFSADSASLFYWIAKPKTNQGLWKLDIRTASSKPYNLRCSEHGAVARKLEITSAGDIVVYLAGQGSETRIVQVGSDHHKLLASGMGQPLGNGSGPFSRVYDQYTAIYSVIDTQTGEITESFLTAVSAYQDESTIIPFIREDSQSIAAQEYPFTDAFITANDNFSLFVYGPTYRRPGTISILDNRSKKWYEPVTIGRGWSYEFGFS